MVDPYCNFVGFFGVQLFAQAMPVIVVHNLDHRD